MLSCQTSVSSWVCFPPYVVETTLKATRKCTQELPQSLPQPITKAVRVLDFRSYHPVIKLWFFLPKKNCSSPLKPEGHLRNISKGREMLYFEFCIYIYICIYEN